MIFSKTKKVLSAVLSLAMIGTMFASVPFAASAATAKAASSTDTDVGVSYQTQIQTYGWQTAVSDGALSGTVGKSKRLEAIKISLTGDDLPSGASITYQTQVQTYGWQTAVSDGALAGTVGKSKRLEAVRVTLSGMPGYEVMYKVQGQTYGWQDWRTTENGTAIASAALAGTVGKAKRLEAIEIKLSKTTTETAAETAAEEAVTTAETSQLQSDVDSATALVDDVEVASVKSALEARLDAINATTSESSGTSSVGDLAVSSVAATSAKTIAVTFNQAVSDTSEITATVKLNSTSKTVTSSWNDDKTVLTLTSSTKFGTSTYTIDVLNGTTDLGSSSVTFTDQKVAKLTITSTVLGVASGGTTAYATYKAYDQYGADVTSTSLGNEIQVSSGLGTGTPKNGLITLSAGTGITSFFTYTSSGCVLTIYDSTSGATTTKTLTISSTVGTLSSFTLGSELQTYDGTAATMKANTTDTYYIPFTATDVSGNTTTNYNYIKAGLLFSTSPYLTSSSTNVLAKLTKDPEDTSKAVIEVTYDTSSTANTVNTPVTITAMTSTGSSSQLQFTLYKAAVCDTFTLESPDTDIAHGETCDIPFTAEDQDGNTLTSYSDIEGYVTISGAKLKEDADGTAYLYFDASSIGSDTASATSTLTATTTSGNYSSITITVQKTAYPDALSLDSTKYFSAMETGATQNLDIGSNNGGLTAVDQYDRDYDLTATDSDYEVLAFSSSTSYVKAGTPGTGTLTVASTATASDNYSYSGNQIAITAVKAGSATVTFYLVKKTQSYTNTDAQDYGDDAADSVALDSQSITFSVIDPDSIVGYGIQAVGNNSAITTQYAVATASNDLTSVAAAYAKEYQVYGKTSSSAKVYLYTTANTTTMTAASASGDFYAAQESGTNNKVRVYGLQYDSSSQSTSTGTLTVVLKDLTSSSNDTNKTYHTLTASLASSSTTPVATSITYKVNKTTGASVTDDIVTIPEAFSSNFQVVYDNDTASVTPTSDMPFYFYAADQYSTKANVVSVYAGSAKAYTDSTYGTATDTDVSVTVNSNGTLSFSGASSGDYIGFTLTGVTASGLTKTVTINTIAP